VTGMLNFLRNEGKVESFSAGETIFAEGQAGEVMYVVTSGEVDILLRGQSVETVGPGGIVGELALIDTSPRSATVVARTDCALAPIDARRFQRLVQDTPYFAIQVMQVLADRLRRMARYV